MRNRKTGLYGNVYTVTICIYGYRAKISSFRVTAFRGSVEGKPMGGDAMRCSLGWGGGGGTVVGRGQGTQKFGGNFCRKNPKILLLDSEVFRQRRFTNPRALRRSMSRLRIRIRCQRRLTHPGSHVKFQKSGPLRKVRSLYFAIWLAKVKGSLGLLSLKPPEKRYN
jgi:hypothetical protein